MKTKHLLIPAGAIIVAFLIIFLYQRSADVFLKNQIGQKIDSLHGVYVYYNGRVGHVSERNISKDGYNIGLKYQCVEFVKRYYYEYLHHKMPNSYGHAKDFFNPKIKDCGYNPQRALTQCTNPSRLKPKENDLLVYSGTIGNPYGHVAIISKVDSQKIEIIQQNPGLDGSSRVWMSMVKTNTGYWKIENDRIMGWLRK